MEKMSHGHSCSTTTTTYRSAHNDNIGKQWTKPAALLVWGMGRRWPARPERTLTQARAVRCGLSHAPESFKCI